jgi:hypothetical protein
MLNWLKTVFVKFQVQYVVLFEHVVYPIEIVSYFIISQDLVSIP